MRLRRGIVGGDDAEVLDAEEEVSDGLGLIGGDSCSPSFCGNPLLSSPFLLCASRLATPRFTPKVGTVEVGVGRDALMGDEVRLVLLALEDDDGANAFIE
mmetsp:Transcript_38986/g.76885  ORF Transcript_38986/g.76885 Transcript_38986/m.76885 type:complete len:100 (+) Transcript_38986:44-343(+)